MRSKASTRHAGCYALLAVLALLTQAHPSFAEQQLACITILPGETAASLAKRISGDARHMQESWFQIVNTSTSQLVSKGAYDRIFPGWKACVASAPQPVVATSLMPSAMQLIPSAIQVIPSAMQTMSSMIGWRTVVVLWGTMMLSLVVACRSTEQYFKDRERMLFRMKLFADRFVQEFERPLIEPDRAGRPIESQVRFSPARSRVDVLLTPIGGHRYPNLTDHKKNVLYDVQRVQEAVGDRAFVSRQPYVQGRWVVVPFQLKVGPKRGR